MQRNRKNMFYMLVVMLTFLTIGCSSQPKKECVFKNAEEIPAFLENGLLKELSLQGHIYVDDTNGICRITIPVTYKYTHQYWETAVGYTAYFELFKNGYINPMGDSLFILSIKYNILSKNSEAIYKCVQPGNFDIYYKYSRYLMYCNYVISSMTPSDFQAYDWAMEVLFEKTGNKLFDRPFGAFFEELSIDDNLDPGEKYVLNELIEWTETRGDIEKPDHFLYFLNSFDDFDSVYYINAEDDTLQKSGSCYNFHFSFAAQPKIFIVNPPVDNQK